MDTQLAEVVQQLAALQAQLQSERQERLSLQEQVGTLQRALLDEQKKRKQITEWIRDNIGPNLEHVMDRVSAALKEEETPTTKRRERPRKKTTSRSETPSASIPSTPSVPRSDPPASPPTSDTNKILPVIDKVNITLNLILERVEDLTFSSKEYFDTIPRKKHPLSS
jgi:hypothetical protein